MRTINVTINGMFLTKDSKNGGVQGEGNATQLHLVFDSTWQGYGKRVIWRDAYGENPVAVVLTPTVDGLIDGDTLTFDTPIPSEALAKPGWCSFTIDGYQDTDPAAVALTVSDCLKVYPNDTDYQPAEPTPSQAQQIMAAIEQIVPDMQEIATEAKSWAVGGTGSRTGEDTDNAKYYSQQASSSAAAASSAAEDAAGSAAEAEDQSDLAAAWAVASQLARNEAQQAQTAAEGAQAAAETAKAGALAAESGAQASKEAAQAAQTAAETAAEGASTSKEAAQAAAQAAETAKEETLVAAGQVEDANQQAASSASQAQESRQAAQEHAEDALEYANAAKSWAVGGTGTRAGEDTDNAEYYSKNSSSMLTYAGIMAGVSNMWAEGGWGSDEFSYGPINPNGSQIINTAEALINGAEYQIEVQLPGYIQTYSYVYTDVLTIPGILSMRQISGAVRISNLSSGTISGTVKRLSASLPEGSYDAKYWAQQAQEASQGVSSFNNRTGAVTPQSGDYSADMIADLPFTVLKGTVEAPIDLLAISGASNTYKRYYAQVDVSNLQNCFVDYSEIFNEEMSSPFEAMTTWEIILRCIVMNGLLSIFIDSGGYIMGQFFTYGNVMDTWVSVSWIVENGALMPHNTRLYIFPDIESVAAPSTSSQRTLSATGWIGEEAPYTQEVSSGTNNKNANGYVALPQTATAAQIEAAQKARLRVSAQTFYQFTVTADGEKPTVDIPIQVTLLGDSPDYQ